MDRIQQILVAKWLSQEFDRTGFHGLHRHGNMPMPGDEDDGDPDARVNQLVLKVQAVDSRESYVQNQATWTIWPFAAEEFLRRPEGLGTQAHRLQHALDGGANQVIVIDDENGG